MMPEAGTFRRWMAQKYFLFRSDISPKALVVEPLNDCLGIDLCSHSDDTLKDKRSRRDLPGGTRASLGVSLNAWRSSLHRNAERLGPGFGGRHWQAPSRNDQHLPPRW